MRLRPRRRNAAPAPASPPEKSAAVSGVRPGCWCAQVAATSGFRVDQLVIDVGEVGPALSKAVLLEESLTAEGLKLRYSSINGRPIGQLGQPRHDPERAIQVLAAG